uniref:Uncharacterized protein n=1 Tax=Arundo donax TaxID=35708 RepID=A0A0A8Y064_ARUDO
MKSINLSVNFRIDLEHAKDLSLGCKQYDRNN